MISCHFICVTSVAYVPTPPNFLFRKIIKSFMEIETEEALDERKFVS